MLCFKSHILTSKVQVKLSLNKSVILPLNFKIFEMQLRKNHQGVYTHCVLVLHFVLESTVLRIKVITGFHE